MAAPYFPTPFKFDDVLEWLGAADNGLSYDFHTIGVVTDATTYAMYVVWTDARPQPSWAYISPGGAGWTAYSTYYVNNTPIYRAEGDAALASFKTDNINRTIANATRSFNSAFQVSSSKDAMVSYSVQIASTLSLVTGQTGTASLQICATSGGSYTEVARFTNGNTGTLAVGLNLTQTVTNNLSAMVPAGYYVKIVTSGTATISYVVGQETLF